MEYRREIDGLRALAVLPVILFHGGFETFGGGFVGVDVFFVISGYLITAMILAEKENDTFSLLCFYERRARRILPALFLVIFACLPFAWLWMLPNELKSFSQSVVAVSIFASNIEFLRTSGYFDAAAELKPLLHTWSLAVEEQYYVLFPLCLLLTWRLGKPWILAMLAVIATVSLATAQWGSVANPSAAFYLLPTRGWELLVGAFVAFYFSREIKWQPSKRIGEVGGLLGLLLLAYAVFAFDKQTPYPSIYTLIPTIGTALIIICATRQSVVGKLLGNQLFVGVGLISYSAYLWHQPLFAFARLKSLGEPSNLSMTVLALTAFTLAYFSWKYIEKPFRSRQQFSRKQVFLYGSVGSAMFVLLGMLGHFSSGFAFRDPPGYLPKNYYQDVKFIPTQKFGIDGRACLSESASICEVAAFAGAKNILLLGDSHSADFSDEFRKFVNDRKYSASQLSVAGCGFIFSQIRRHNGECGKAIELLKESLIRKKFDVVIFVGDFYGHTKNSSNAIFREDMNSLASLISFMINTSGEVWLFTPRYSLSSDPMRAAMLNRLSDVRVVNMDSISRVDVRFSQFTTNANLKIFNERDYLIDLGGSGVQKFNGHTSDYEPIYMDTNHLTRYSTKLVFDKFISGSGL